MPELKPEPEIRLPLAEAEDARVVAFPIQGQDSAHLAILIGQKESGKIPLVRLHSSCCTGDVFGSLRCDCGPQLHESIRLISAHGFGVLLYLQQEGRGIGLLAKLQAYRLQDTGMDTFEANEALGHKADGRDYSVAAEMLAHLGLREIDLLTNNPAKVEALQSYNIIIRKRVPLVVAPNPHNAKYLEIKASRAGHYL